MKQKNVHENKYAVINKKKVNFHRSFYCLSYILNFIGTGLHSLG